MPEIQVKDKLITLEELGAALDGKAGVTGIKGSAETGDYRRGNVSLSTEDIGAVSKTGNQTITGDLTLKPSSGEGGQITLDAASDHPEQAGINIDRYGSSKLRIFGEPSADTTSITGSGTPLQIDPYAKTITGGYTFTGNVTGDCSGNAANVTGAVQVAHGGTGATEARVLIGGAGYSSILNGINAVRTTRIFPISMRKTSDYCADAPSGYESSEANILLVGDEARITATLYLFAHPNGKRIYVRDFYQGNWFNQWTQIY